MQHQHLGTTAYWKAGSTLDPRHSASATVSSVSVVGRAVLESLSRMMMSTAFAFSSNLVTGRPPLSARLGTRTAFAPTNPGEPPTSRKRAITAPSRRTARNWNARGTPIARRCMALCCPSSIHSPSEAHTPVLLRISPASPRATQDGGASAAPRPRCRSLCPVPPLAGWILLAGETKTSANRGVGSVGRTGRSAPNFVGSQRGSHARCARAEGPRRRSAVSLAREGVYLPIFEVRQDERGGWDRYPFVSDGRLRAFRIAELPGPAKGAGGGRLPRADAH